MRSFPVALVVCLVAPAALAPQISRAQTATLQSGRYLVDTEHTWINLSVANLYEGRMVGVSGILDLSTKNPSKSTLTVSVPVATLASTNPTIDATLKSADWLDAQHYPTVTFTATKVTRDIQDTAKVTGDLTLHGVTRPVTFAVRLLDSSLDPATKKRTAGFEITGDIDRNDFGVTAFGAMVPAAVHVSINGAFEQK